MGDESKICGPRGTVWLTPSPPLPGQEVEFLPGDIMRWTGIPVVLVEQPNMFGLVIGVED